MTVAEARHVLELRGRESADDVKRQYRALAYAYHPDRAAPEGQAAANEKLRNLNEAYRVLTEESAQPAPKRPRKRARRAAPRRTRAPKRKRPRKAPTKKRARSRATSASKRARKPARRANRAVRPSKRTPRRPTRSKRRAPRTRTSSSARDRDPYYIFRKDRTAKIGWRKYGGPYPTWEEADAVTSGIARRASGGNLVDWRQVKNAFFIGKRAPVDRWGRPRVNVAEYARYQEQPWIA